MPAASDPPAADKLLLLDLDGTVRQSRSNPQGFINHPDDQEVIPKAEDAIARYVGAGYRLVGVTNQGGVGAGFKTMGACLDEQIRTLDLVPALDAIFFCPAAPDDPGRTCYELRRSWEIQTHNGNWEQIHAFSGYRKPFPGMLVMAIYTYGATPIHGGVNLMVGDRPEDKEAATRAGVPFRWAREWWNGDVA